MKIISKFKDYYDGGAVYGIDEHRKYVRETIKKSIFYKQISDLTTNLLGFCGELFLFTNHYLNKNDPKKFVLWDKDAVTKQWNWYYEDEMKLVNRDLILKTIDSNAYIKNLKSNPKYLNYFYKYNTPIWIIDYFKSELILNPRLENLGFAKFYNTIEAFQKIEQYISNELAQSMQKEVPVGNNEVIGRSKGFDEYSFRNAKKKPKKF